MLIDTHFHLDLMENMQTMISQFRLSDVGVLAVGTTPKAYEREIKFTDGVNNIRVGLGLHPQLIHERRNETDLFLKLMEKTRYIGEIGLDFNTRYASSKREQIACFRNIVKLCAEKGNKVLSIHSVRATETVINELYKAGTFKNNVCIFHWFTGTSQECQKAADYGAFFSINPRMLHTKSGQTIIKMIPRERILIETDAPFTKNILSVNELKEELYGVLEGISELRCEDISKQLITNEEIIWDM